MLIRSVLEPSLIHIPRDDWTDEVALAFEKRWLCLVEAIRRSEGVGFQHELSSSTALDLLIFQGDRPVWLDDPTWKQRLLCIYYSRFRPRLSEIGDDDEADPVDVTPPLGSRPTSDPWYAETLSLLSRAIRKPETLMVQIGIQGTTADCAAVSRSGDYLKSVPLCHEYEDFLASLPLSSLSEIARGEDFPAVAECALDVSSGKGHSRVYNEITYTERFLRQFDGAEKVLKPRILEAVVKRARLTQRQAQADKGLMDKPYKGSTQRRCRVNRDWRVHYSYCGESSIKFESVGPHDQDL